MACLPRSARISLLEPVTWSTWRRPMMSTISSKPFSASRNPSLERALSSIDRLERRLMRERRHHLLGEAPQRLNTAGGVKKQIFRTDVLERLEPGDDFVGRAVEGACFGGLVSVRVGHDARLVLAVRTLREPVYALPSSHPRLDRLFSFIPSHNNIDGPSDADTHRIEDPLVCFNGSFEERDALADLLDRRELVEQQVISARGNFRD